MSPSRKHQSKIPGNDTTTPRAGSFFEEFTLARQMFSDYRNGSYRKVPWKLIASVVFAVFYLIFPFDLIPDFIPVLGLADDISVFSLVLAGFKSEITDYRNWRETHPQENERIEK